MFFLLPLLPTIANGIAMGILGATAVGATVKSIQFGFEADEIRERAKSSLDGKSRELEREVDMTKSAIESFGIAKLSVIKTELKEAERVLSKFYGKRILEINAENFPNEKFVCKDIALGFGAFGTKYVPPRFSGVTSFLDPCAVIIKARQKLDDAREFQRKAGVSCELMENRIQSMKALRKRTDEGAEVLRSLRETLMKLLRSAENSKKADPMIFVRILCVASTLKKVAEVALCSSDGTLSDDAGKLFRKALLEAA